MNQLVEQYFQCPYCWENISMLIDTSEDSQEYVEDCEVCCQPITVQYTARNGQIENINARSMD